MRMSFGDRVSLLRQFLTLPGSRSYGAVGNRVATRRPRTVDFTIKFNPFEKCKPIIGGVAAAAAAADARRKEGNAARQAKAAQPEENEEAGEECGSSEEATAGAGNGFGEDVPASSILHEAYIPPFMEGMKTRQLFASNIHIRQGTPNVIVNRVEFIKSSANAAECPQDGYPEFAMIGHSNVGKSSLVNLLVNRKKMALVSKKPGKTQLINHFLINKSWYLVDLPGYGYAKAPKALCLNWNEFTKDYFKRRKTLAMVILLVDSTNPVKQIDLDCALWLVKNNVPMTIAFTKCDRRSGAGAVKNVVVFLQKLKASHPCTPAWIMTSCVSGQGRQELMLYLSEMRRFWHS